MSPPETSYTACFPEQQFIILARVSPKWVTSSKNKHGAVFGDCCYRTRAFVFTQLGVRYKVYQSLGVNVTSQVCRL